MYYQGVLKKMTTEFTEPISYYLLFPNDFVQVNQAIGKKLHFQFIKYQCLHCGLDKKIFRQGFCKSCFFEIPQAADWVIRPELSTAHKDIEDRNLAYEKKIQLQPHIVYLANSSAIKVGVTRKSQLPTRWIDQGATRALELLEVPNRYLAGITEVALKQHISDTTNYRNMLRYNPENNPNEAQELLATREQLKPYIPEEVNAYFLEHKKPLKLVFPVTHYPEKPKSISFDKITDFTGILVGIKGQYLIFENNSVLNIRSNEGYVVQLSIL